jgi:proteic killer suppression protein
LIKTFSHKGLEIFFYRGTKKGIQPKHAEKLGLILDRLDAAHDVKDMNYPGSGFHPLMGEYQGYHAVKVSGNWRVIFKFEGGNAYDVDYLDYH